MICNECSVFRIVFHHATSWSQLDLWRQTGEQIYTGLQFLHFLYVVFGFEKNRMEWNRIEYNFVFLSRNGEIPVFQQQHTLMKWIPWKTWKNKNKNMANPINVDKYHAVNERLYIKIIILHIGKYCTWGRWLCGGTACGSAPSCSVEGSA